MLSVDEFCAAAIPWLGWMEASLTNRLLPSRRDFQAEMGLIVTCIRVSWFYVSWFTIVRAVFSLGGASFLFLSTQ